MPYISNRELKKIKRLFNVAVFLWVLWGVVLFITLIGE